MTAVPASGAPGNIVTAEAGKGGIPGPAAAPAKASGPAPSFWRTFRRAMLGNPVTLAAFAMLVVFLIAAVAGPWLVPYDPLASDTSQSLKPPSRAHWFGTDQLGRDIFSRVVAAARMDLGIALAAVAASFAVGSLAGAAAGFFGGWTQRVISRVVDTIMAFPLFVLAMGIVAAMGNTVGNIVFATAIINLPFYARLARSETAIRREAGFVEAARLGGNREAGILLRVLYPNALPPLVVQASLNLGWAILNAAGLSFIGLGVRPPAPEWGIMISDGANYVVSGEWWIALFPGLALMAAVLCFNLLGDGLRDLIDPRRKT